jgi:hypothetical protein
MVKVSECVTEQVAVVEESNRPLLPNFRIHLYVIDPSQVGLYYRSVVSIFSLEWKIIRRFSSCE